MSFFSKIQNKLGFAFIAILMLSLLFPGNFTQSASTQQLVLLTETEESALMQIFMTDRIKKIDSVMHNFVSKRRFNGNVLVALNHKLIYQASFGYANFKKRSPLNIYSSFQLASISKQFTAMAILLLHQQKDLHIDSKACSYIPELPYKDVTVRQLLNHTAGLPNYMGYLEKEWHEPVLPDNQAMIDLLATLYPNPYFFPGRRFNYSNTAYAILASIVERVSGNDFSTFLRQHFFDPLGMYNTFTSSELLDNRFVSDNIAIGHRRTRSGYYSTTTTINDKVLGDKGIFSTILDLYKWDQALYSGKLIDPELLTEAYTPVKLQNKKSYPYGFGFRIDQRENEKVIYHNGLWEGFRNSFFRYIERGNTIIVLNNVNLSVNNEVVKQLESIIEQPLPPDPTQRLVFKLVDSGTGPTMQLLKSMQKHGEISLPDRDKLLEVAWLFTKMNKPVLSSRVMRFYNATCLPEEEAI